MRGLADGSPAKTRHAAIRCECGAYSSANRKTSRTGGACLWRLGWRQSCLVNFDKKLMARPLGPVVRLGPSSGSRRRRAGVRRRQRRARLGLLALALLVSGVSLATSLLVSTRHRSPFSAVIDTSRHDGVAQVAFQPAKTRADYRYSVIPRGVFSAQELNVAIDSDPVVAAHYQSFDASRATLATLEHSRLAYVSYRLRDRVFWTRHAVRLPAGELVLTDGREIVRARCGNRISALPGEVAADEPDPVLLDTPVESDPPAADPVAAVAAMPGIPVLLLSPPAVVDFDDSDLSGAGTGQPVVQAQRTDDPVSQGPEPSEGSPVIITPRGPRVRSVPEPSSLLLVTAGLIGIMCRRLKARQNS